MEILVYYYYCEQVSTYLIKIKKQFLSLIFLNRDVSSKIIAYSRDFIIDTMHSVANAV